jgi:hypothetical protein
MIGHLMRPGTQDRNCPPRPAGSAPVGRHFLPTLVPILTARQA